MKLSTKGTFIVVLPLVMQVCFMAVLVVLLAEGQADIERQLHSKQVVNVAERTVGQGFESNSFT